MYFQKKKKKMKAEGQFSNFLCLLFDFFNVSFPVCSQQSLLTFMLCPVPDLPVHLFFLVPHAFSD